VPAKPAIKRGQIKHFARFKPMNTMAILASDAGWPIAVSMHLSFHRLRYNTS